MISFNGVQLYKQMKNEIGLKKKLELIFIHEVYRDKRHDIVQLSR